MIDAFAIYNIVYDSLLNSTNKYVTSLAILIGFYIFYKFFLIIIKRVILRITEHTKTDLDEKLVNSTEGPVSYILFMIGIKLALIPFELSGAFGFYSNKVANSIIILLVGLFLIRLSSTLIKQFGARWAKKTKSSLDDALIPVFNNFAIIVIIVFVVIFTLQSWDIDITSLLAGVGIAGLALGFAVKDSLANIFGGISLILDKAVRVGDRIEVGSVSGIVHDVGIRSTKVRTWDNEIIVIPNGELANSQIKNYQFPNKKQRIILEFGVEYGSKHDKVKKLALGTLKNMEFVLDDPEPFCNFDSMADSALIFKLFFWVDDIANKFSTKEKVTCRLYDSLNKAKIGIPFPQMDVHMKKK
ncbi:mechanosensitive ion channel [Candidatus Woesearchaeota archaeon]|nr:mechanosensitive ion channel [Candidatus Woesearchaeota archaeon]